MRANEDGRGRGKTGPLYSCVAQHKRGELERREVNEDGRGKGKTGPLYSYVAQHKR